MRFDPRGKANRALIVGVSEYDHTKADTPDGVPGQLPGVRYNRTTLTEALHRGGVFREGEIVECASPTQDGFVAAVRRAAQDARGLLLLYFAGHGIVTSYGDELFLQMRNARVARGKQEAFPGAVQMTAVLAELAAGNAERIVVILDCCYAGNAAGVWHRFEPRDRQKILLLMSVQSNRLIHRGDGRRATPFTRHLVRLLQESGDGGGEGDGGDGDAGGGGELWLSELYPALKERMRKARVPTASDEPQDPQAVWEPGEDVLLRAVGPGPVPRTGWRGVLRTAVAFLHDTMDRLRRRLRLLLVLVLALAALAAGGYAVAVLIIDDAPCAPPLELRVLTDPDLEPALSAAADAYLVSDADTDDDGCRRTGITVFSAGAADAVAGLRDRTDAWQQPRDDDDPQRDIGPQPDVWIPASAADVTRVTAGQEPRVFAHLQPMGAPLAYSPVVLAVPTGGGTTATTTGAPGAGTGVTGARARATGAEVTGAQVTGAGSGAGGAGVAGTGRPSAGTEGTRRASARTAGAATGAGSGSARAAGVAGAIGAGSANVRPTQAAWVGDTSTDETVTAGAGGEGSLARIVAAFEARGGRPQVLRPDPEFTDTGLLATMGLYAQGADARSAERSVGQAGPPSPTAGELLCTLPYDPAQDARSAVLAPEFLLKSGVGCASEMVRARRVAQYPDDVPALQPTFVRVRWEDGDQDAQARDAAVKRFHEWLSGDGGRRVLGAYGFRSADAPHRLLGPGPAAPGVRTDPAMPHETAEATAMNAALERYRSVGGPGRVLFLLDSSGSMARTWEGPSGGPGLLKQSLGGLGDQDEYGVWAVAGTSGRTHTDLLPFGTHRRADAVRALDPGGSARVRDAEADPHAALLDALAFLHGRGTDDQRPQLIVYLTDDEDNTRLTGRALDDVLQRARTAGVPVAMVSLATGGCDGGRPDARISAASSGRCLDPGDDLGAALHDEVARTGTGEE
ncbi:MULTISPECIES: caspase family protein [unclassified Streptomyces]|uniref:caspase family protein n=1 Tax=unclassified Streptomyces TaxID=2593676 RepID=UPI0036F87CF1